ncbi:MAG: hypothetical protein CVT82_00440 [Alphaproteobacteria bacterium HGW-Alphaproteobacteria-4]|nr:MAG: hypothetical protein CVT82_00440 [Alphaproteobacteria bacterium HGW-Alphaproteobacteria-4]
MFLTPETRIALADAAWAVALRLGTFGYAEISAELHVSMYQATEIVRAWEKDGACINIQRGVGRRNLYRVVAEFPRTREAGTGGSVPLNLWTSMRGLKSFTPTDLASHSSTVSVPVRLEAAQGYCQALLKAGYLKVERTAVPGRREAIYRLIRNTGPRPPRERRVRALWDDNLSELVLLNGGLQ